MMQYLVLALLAIIFLLVLQLLRRLDEVARAVQELSANIKSRAEVEKTSKTPRY